MTELTMPEEIAKANIEHGETSAIVTRDLGGDRLRITKQQREEILQLYVSGEPRKAQLYAMNLGLREQYAYRLARERGAIPFTSSGHSHRESEPQNPVPLRYAPAGAIPNELPQSMPLPSHSGLR
jgi:hypothetical protein